MGLREKAHRLLFVQRLGMLQDVYDQAKEDVADKDRANQNNPEHYERSALPHSLLILHRIRRRANTTFGERGYPSGSSASRIRQLSLSLPVLPDGLTSRVLEV
jgi:hypothetical protein